MYCTEVTEHKCCYLCVTVFVHTRARVCVRACMCACVCVCVCVCCVCMHARMCVCMRAHMCVCIIYGINVGHTGRVLLHCQSSGFLWTNQLFLHLRQDHRVRSTCNTD